ncbi:unnamed protein product [Durusdinium trenchii]|uniref:Uncharacterized protein n=1 Tax=Durusdinium trenchii TaxID=1381693 RepID=A0ABP0NDF1_9DINO
MEDNFVGKLPRGAWTSDPRLATAILSSLSKQGKSQEVIALLKQLAHCSVEIDVVHWGAASRVFENHWRQSLAMLRHGQILDLSPNEFILSSAVSSCSRKNAHGAWPIALDLLCNRISNEALASPQARTCVEG